VDDDPIAERVRQLVDAWPLLTDEQVARVSFLLRPSTPDASPPIDQITAA
jgi:hypothetical protein